ncbi:c-type cytochrome biogenesis protein CcmI [uncultured Jannaschia sp.]|uniref:c-type cytochrome biogenesis protein CcmI n=1 Tax=uncultured Jannaschia sp. TaxID=293347 RepID=UPI002614AD5C|nr:c-type cytochrome biogenesis protein CcmI [uncultured Jannaschia sp.]
MTLWIVLVAMIGVAAVVMAMPFLRRGTDPSAETDQSIALARSQIDEIEADVARGVLDPREGQAARLEIERRIVALARAPKAALRLSSDKVRLSAVAILCGWVVIGATALYAVIGRPDLPAAPHLASGGGNLPAAGGLESVARDDAATANQPPVGTVDTAIANLAARLETTPDDADGWRMLGWSYFNVGRYSEASAAYGRAVALVDDDPELWSLYGETLARAASGQVTEAAEAAFASALALNPSDARARFFAGMAAEQAGDVEGALEIWITLLNDARPDADWAPGVLQRIRELASRNGIDVAARLPDTETLLPPRSAMPAPSREEVEAAERMAPEDRQAMILGMVDQLEARLDSDPDDPDGWMRLMQSRMVLGDPEAAKEAYLGAVQHFGASSEIRSRIDDKARELGLGVE